jgi:molecular chaperone DnaJ
MSNYYDLLGITKSSTPDEIKKAYRKMAHQYHPDKNSGDKAAEAKFKEVNNAYEVLSDPQKKSQYDKFGSVSPNMGAGGFGGAGGGFGAGSPFDGMDFGFDDGVNINDFINSFFNQQSGGGRGRGGQPKSSRAKGVDIEVGIELTLEEIATGAAKQFDLKHNTLCKHCTGKGFEPHSRVSECNTCGGQGKVFQRYQTLFGMVQQEIVCPDCEGRGKIFETKCTICRGQGYSQEVEQIKIEVPVGISQSERIRIRGKGEAGYRGSDAGDLFLVVQVKKHIEFEREGTTIYSNLELDYFDFILGTKKTVNTVWGELEVTVPQNTNPDSKLKIKEKGMPKLNNPKSKGDHILKLKVKMPNLTAVQMEEVRKIKG